MQFMMPRMLMTHPQDSVLLAAQTGKREAVIEEAVMGNMGTLYRVRLGPFASSKEVDSACPRLRDAGLDCLVLSR